jgi:low affinity Fe/Cu permease
LSDIVIGAAAQATKRRRHHPNNYLFLVAEFLSRPPGFYAVLVGMLACTALVPFGLTEIVTYILSVAAIFITGVVLIQGYRDTAALHAKLDELILALRETRNEVVGLEHEDPSRIKAALDSLEEEAANGGRPGQG